MKKSILFALGMLLATTCCAEKTEHLDSLQSKLKQGWNTWNNASIACFVHLPDGFAINLGFKQHDWIEERYLPEVLIGQHGEESEQVHPGYHAYDGSYLNFNLRWEHLEARVEACHDGDDLVLLVTPLATPEKPVSLIAETALLWNKPGSLAKTDESLIATIPGDSITFFTNTGPIFDPFVPTKTPHWVLPLEKPVVLSSGKPRAYGNARQALDTARNNLIAEASVYGELAETYLAVQSGIAWNVIYDPKNDRVVPTVGRLWNAEYGGYCLFGWDNFFLARAIAFSHRDLALAALLEHLNGLTEGGFIPNDNTGNGRKTWDRSQPPVGSLMALEIYHHYPEMWLLEEIYSPLLQWNRWWMNHRLNADLLAFGSHEAKNPLNEPNRRTKITAGYESGMDDSPMYTNVRFDSTTNTMALQDVGLNCLYIADCRALMQIATLLGNDQDAEELDERAAVISARMKPLWDETSGAFLNRNTDADTLSSRLSPTIFYSLLTTLPNHDQRTRILQHFYNTEEFYGEWMLPSIARNDADFPRQRYWKGAIWPPLNFLTWRALHFSGYHDAARELANKSHRLFMQEWQNKGIVGENYSAIAGTADDQRLSSDRFHSWGILMGLMQLLENSENKNTTKKGY